jgi:outer membrane protein OmpA-like peptidoglycan-associated protein
MVKRCPLLVLLAFVTLFLGFSGIFKIIHIETISYAAAKTNKKDDADKIILLELQSAVMSFADTFAQTIASTALDLERTLQTPEARLKAANIRVYSVAAACEIAADAQPGVALLDMVVLVTLNRMVWEDYWQPEVFGQAAEDMVEALRKLEKGIWSIAARVLTQGQQKELRELLEEWRKANPKQRRVDYIRFSDFGDQLGRKPVLRTALRPGGLLAPVKEAVEVAEEIRMTVERAMYLLSRLQLIAGLQAELVFKKMVTEPEVTALLSQIGSLEEISERYAEILNQLPVEILAQVNTTIDKLMGQIAEERQAMIGQVMREVSAERAAAIAQAFEGLAEERKRTLGEINRLVNQGGREVEESMNHAFILAAAFVLILFLIVLAYRYASEQSAGVNRRKLITSATLLGIAVLVIIATIVYSQRSLRTAPSFEALEEQTTQKGTDTQEISRSSIKEVSRPDSHTSPAEACAIIVSVSGQKIVKEGMFETEKWEIRPEAYPNLDRMASVLKTCPSVKLEIQGHTDNRGSEDFNKLLSENRAKAVKDYLVRKGIQEDRLTAVGYGSTKPLASNDTPEGRAQNRRVEIRPMQ